MTPPAEAVWIAHPDVVTSAIKLLAGVVTLLGATLISVLIYIWQSHKKQQEKIEEKVDKIAVSLEQLAMNFEHRLTTIEARCEERDCRAA